MKDIARQEEWATIADNAVVVPLVWSRHVTARDLTMMAAAGGPEGETEMLAAGGNGAVGVVA